jgi:hypothetical protein
MQRRPSTRRRSEIEAGESAKRITLMIGRRSLMAEGVRVTREAIEMRQN